MSVDWFSGAEQVVVLNDFYSQVGMAADTTSPVPRTGDYCYRFASSAARSAYRLLNVTSATVVYGMAICFTTGADLLTVTFCGDTNATVHVTFTVNPTSLQVTAYRGTSAGTVLGTSAAALPFDVTGYHYWEFKAVLGDGAAGSVEVRLNNNVVLTVSGVDTKNAGAAAVFDAVRLNMPDNNGATSCGFDDMYITTGATGYLGDIKIYPLRPTGNGNSSQLTGSDGNSTDNYLLVDELSPSATDYNGHATVANKDTYVLTDLASTSVTVHGTRTSAYAAKSDAGAKSGRIVTRTNSTDYGGTDAALSTSYLSFDEFRVTNPNSGVAWTGSDINALEVGWEVRT
jgi:hypothetical protein